MSFVRRYTSMPSADVISQIEGIVIIDQPIPTNVQGVSTGVVGMVGEFADMKYAVSVVNGDVSTKIQPVEVVPGSDLLAKVGGFDETLGDFGGDDGNGYAALINKPWARLVVATVNLASPKATRAWRELPTNVDGTATPITPVTAVTVPAGTVFKDTNGKLVKVATSFTFESDIPFLTGNNASIPLDTDAVGTITVTGADFAAAGVKVGDAVVLGSIGAGTYAGTYRIVTVGSTTLSVQQLDGSNLSWPALSDISYRIHRAASFDTGGNTVLTNTSGYTLPARPLEAVVSAADSMDPVVAAPAGSLSAWEPLSGLVLRAHPTAGLPYDVTVQAANAATSTAIETLYKNALTAMLADEDPIADVSIVFSARTSDDIRTALRSHVRTASATGRGRVAVISPKLTTVSLTTVTGNTAEGVGYARDERVIYCWPGFQTVIDAAQNLPIKRADGSTSTTGNGVLDVRSDAYMASILSNLASERNPGQSAAPVPTCLQSVVGVQLGSVPKLNMGDYITFRQYGIAAPRKDRSSGWQFQSGITTSLTANQKNINRRRMADEVQDSLAALYEKFSKLPLTIALKDQIDSETVAYFNGLLSPNNPAAQRIEGFLVDSKSGNTASLNAQGIYVVITKVRMLGMADDIVIQSEVGPTVSVTVA